MRESIQIERAMVQALDEEAPPANRGKLILAAGLALLSLAYLGKGFFYGMFLDGSDVWRRWLEEQFVLGREHLDPAIVAAFIRKEVIYPPWSYFSGALFFWPGWPQVRIWFGLINLACLIWIVRFAAAYARDESKLDRTLLVLSVTAIAAICTTLGVGNYGVIVLALLIGSYQADEAGRPILAGLLMGVALLKPQLAGPFLLVAIVRGRFRLVAAAAAYVMVASAAIWMVSPVDPIRMFFQAAQGAGRFADITAGPLTAVLAVGIPYRLAAPLTAIVCLAIFSPMLWRCRERSPMLQFAIAAVLARLWTYNLNTSNLIVFFLLLALWRLASDTSDWRAGALFLAVGASLWVPGHFSDNHAVQLAEQLTWFGGLIGLLILDGRGLVSEELAMARPRAAAAIGIRR